MKFKGRGGREESKHGNEVTQVEARLYVYRIQRYKIFDGYNYVLKKSGEEVLEDFCNILAPYADDIKQIEILGHTTQKVDGHQYSVANDRFLHPIEQPQFLLVYIQEKNFMNHPKADQCGTW